MAKSSEDSGAGAPGGKTNATKATTKRTKGMAAGVAATAVRSPITPWERAMIVHHELAEMRHDPEALSRIFREGVYPYKDKMRRAAYEKHKA